MKRKMMRWAGHIARICEIINAYKYFIGKREGKRPLNRPRRRREGNIRMDLREIGWEIVGCIHLVQDKEQWWVL
jgi:hypothetical protein